MRLILYSRDGCCLCEGLEERLRALEVPPALEVLDVDQDPALQVLYGLEVPVLAVRHDDGPPVELPRIPPRLAGEALGRWLQKCLVSLPEATGTH